MVHPKRQAQPVGDNADQASTPEADKLYAFALNEVDGYTLIPASAVERNGQVDAVLVGGAPIVRGELQVVRNK